MILFKTLDQKKEAIAKIKNGEIQEFKNNSLKKLDSHFASSFMEAIDILGANEIWREQFQRQFNLKTGLKAEFNLLSEEDSKNYKFYLQSANKKSAFAVDVTTDVDDVLVTDIFPTIDGLLINADPLLSRVTTITPSQGKIDLDEFGAEIAAENLAENASGTGADDVIRDGDSLDANKSKIQASTTISEQVIRSADATLYANYLARLINRVRARMQLNVLVGSNTSNQFKGIKNVAGATESDQEGALTFTATTPANVIDHLDQLVADMPNTLSSEIEANFVFLMTPKTWKSKVKIARDPDGRYLLSEEERRNATVGGIPVVTVQNGLANDEVVYCSLSNYIIAFGSVFTIKDDGGKSREGVTDDLITIAAKQYCDGGMVMAHKNAVGSGAGANDNHERNLFRITTL